MKMIYKKSLLLSGALLLLTHVSAFAQSSSCPCPALSKPNNSGQVVVSAPWAITHDYAAADNPAYFSVQVNSGPANVPDGTYLGWCVDAADNIGAGPATYSSLFWASCDPFLNTEIGPGYPASVYVSPAVWHEVNYMLNHKNGAYFWNIQLAIWELIGGPTPAAYFLPPFPPNDPAQIAALVAAAKANAAAWQPQCGDTTAVVVQIPNPGSLIQLVILELPCICPLGPGDTATIGFWHNKNGQAVIDNFNCGGPTGTSTALGNWLAGNFPCLYGASSPPGNDLAGKTSSQIAAYFLQLFSVSGQKTYAQILAVALASYATSSTLAGPCSIAGNFGFNISVGGTGSQTFSVGPYGALFGVPNNTSLTVAQLLLGANSLACGGLTSAQFNALNVIFDGINSGGDIK